MSPGHVSTFRQNDWTANMECGFSVSTFYREIAKNSRHLFEKYPKFASNFAVTRDSDKVISTRFAHIYPRQFFLRDRNTLTRGEREIIEGIHRNRAEAVSGNSFGKFESHEVFRQDDRCFVKACHENRSLDRTMFMTEDVCGKSIVYQDSAIPCKHHSSSVCHASRNKHSTSLPLSNVQDTRGLSSENQTQYSMDYLVPWMPQHCQREGQVTKETIKQTARDQNKESFADDVIVTANEGDAVAGKHYLSPICHASRNKHGTSLLSPRTHDNSGQTSENRTKHLTNYHPSWISYHYQSEVEVVKDISKQTAKELNIDSFVDEVIMAVNCKLDHAQSKTHSQPRRLLTGADESLSRLQPHVRKKSTPPTPTTTSFVSRHCSGHTPRSEKSDLLHVRVFNKQERDRKRAEEWITIVEHTKSNSSNADSLNVQQRISEETCKQPVNVNNDNGESRWHKAIQIYIPTAEPELAEVCIPTAEHELAKVCIPTAEPVLAEDDCSLKPEATRSVVLSRERPLSHEEFQRRLERKTTHANTVLCHE
ncbi:hypothetical protein BsWGS_27864 [Bradybaena similaris]